LLNLPYHLRFYDFSYIFWYSLSAWEHEYEINEIGQNNNLTNENFKMFTIDKYSKKEENEVKLICKFHFYKSF